MMEILTQTVAELGAPDSSRRSGTVGWLAGRQDKEGHESIDKKPKWRRTD